MIYHAAGKHCTMPMWSNTFVIFNAWHVSRWKKSTGCVYWVYLWHTFHEECMTKHKQLTVADSTDSLQVNKLSVPTHSGDVTKLHCSQMILSRMCRLLNESVEYTPTTGHNTSKTRSFTSSCTLQCPVLPASRFIVNWSINQLCNEILKLKQWIKLRSQNAENGQLPPINELLTQQ